MFSVYDTRWSISFSSALCWNQSEDLIVTITIGRKILHDLPICFFKLYSCCLIQFNLKLVLLRYFQFFDYTMLFVSHYYCFLLSINYHVSCLYGCHCCYSAISKLDCILIVEFRFEPTTSITAITSATYRYQRYCSYRLQHR